MKIIYRIARLELSSLFYSPIAWLVLILFTVQGGTSFVSQFESLVLFLENGYYNHSITNSIFSSNSSTSLFQGIKANLFLYIPLLTMGLISRELNSGSIKLLLSSPINFRQIVFGKYLAMVIYSMLLTLSLTLFVIAGNYTIQGFDYKLVISGILGLFILICAFSAIGLFISSLTSYQVVAAIGTMAILAFLNYVGEIGQNIPIINDITYWLSMSGRIDQMINGLISSKGVIYYLIVISLFITLTILKLSNKKSSIPKIKTVTSYGLVIIITVFLGYISSRPNYTVYFDMTATKNRTLTPEIQNVLSELQEYPLKITSYVNILDQNMHVSGLPKHKNSNYRRLEKFIRFLPEMEMHYVYYYDTIQGNNEVYKNNLGIYGKELAQKVAKSFNIDFDDVLSPSEIKHQVDLREEDNQYIRQLEYNEKKEFVRMFNDIPHYPSDINMAGALKKIVSGPSRIALIKGHNERTLAKNDKDYEKALSARITNRFSMLNSGFQLESISITDNTISEDIDILVIADPKEQFTKTESQRISDFIDNGGNLLIMTEFNNCKYLDSLVTSLEINFISDRLIQNNKNLSPDFIIGEVTNEARIKIKSSQLNNFFINYNIKDIAMPGAVGLQFLEKSSFKKTPLITSKKNTEFHNVNINIEDSKSSNNYEDKIVLAALLERKINNKEQRIMIVGDADFMSNSMYNSGIVPNINKIVAGGIFKWLSNDKFPVNSSHESGEDTKFKIGTKGVAWLRIIFLGVIPGFIALLGTIILIKRKRK